MLNLLFWLAIFLVSLSALIKAADWFTDAAEKIGLYLGLSQFIVGVTIVALGTSLPELVSSLVAVYQNASEIVVGNVIGSNIANVFLVAGFAAIASKKLTINYNLINVDLPLFIGSAFLLTLTLLDGYFSWGEALICILAYVVYFFYLFNNRHEEQQKSSNSPSKRRFPSQSILIIILSSGLIFLSAHYTITSVSQISTILNISKEVIAVSAVAIGTSLPELSVSLSAAKKGNPEIVVGNVLGSNIFNALMVMGMPRLFGQLEIPSDILSRELPVMLVATLLFFFATQDQQLSKWEGWLFFVFYAWFIGNLFGAL